MIRFRPSRRKLAPALAAAAILAAAAGASTASGTTGAPGTYAVVSVRLGDSSLQLSRKSSHGVNVVAFVIRNVGKRRHQFQIGKTKSSVLRPGQVQDLPVGFDDFGTYPYKVTLNGTRSTHGTFSVRR